MRVDTTLGLPCLLPGPGNLCFFGASPGLRLYIQAASGLGLMTQWSYWPLVQARTEGLGGHGHSDRNDGQNENLNLARCDQIYFLCSSH